MVVTRRRITWVCRLYGVVCAALHSIVSVLFLCLNYDMELCVGATFAATIGGVLLACNMPVGRLVFYVSALCEIPVMALITPMQLCFMLINTSAFCEAMVLILWWASIITGLYLLTFRFWDVNIQRDSRLGPEIGRNVND